MNLIGNYWHSTEYHLNKTIACEKIGYRLIHIFEHEWINKQNIIKQKLIDIFNNNEEIDKTDLLILDRCWYSKNIKINNYILIKETLPTLVNNTYNCGNLIFKSKNE